MDDTVADRMVTDGSWLKRSILNLLSNAYGFTTEGYVHITVHKVDSCTVDQLDKSQEQEPGLQITVTDTGLGVADEYLNQVRPTTA